MDGKPLPNWDDDELSGIADDDALSGQKGASMAHQAVDTELSTRLVEQYRPYVRSIAIDVSRNMATWIELDDLIAYGQIGLVQASQRFDPTSGVNFKTYAYYRIRGAIFDGLREFGWLNRTQYARYKFEQSANEMMSNTLGARGISDVAQDLTSEANELYNVISGLIPVFIVSLDAARHIDIPSDPSENPQSLLEQQQIMVIVRNLIQQLSGQERKLIEDYYYLNKTFEQIGSELGLSKSWISRLHTKVMRKLKSMLREHGVESA